MLKLKLRYRFCSLDDYAVEIVEQDESLRYNARTLKKIYTFNARNGWTFMSSACPEIRSMSRVFYIRGTSFNRDNDVLYCDYRAMCGIATAVAELNGRKNVVEIADSGGYVY